MRNAFTLVELLVVITIIVVLLALLTPALDRAVYQAQLALCGTTLHGLGVAVQTYAFDHKRRYPYRKAVSQLTGERPILVAYNCNPATGKFDDRPTLRPYVSINKSLNCPLAAQVEIDNASPDVCTYASFALWFDWRYRLPGEQGMHKLGDRFTWKGESFDILAGDWDNYFLDAAESTSTATESNSHPDPDGVMRNSPLHEQDWVTGSTAAGMKVSHSFWGATGTPDRGLVDNNYVYSDGAVHRFNGVAIIDPRMVRVPQTNDDSQKTWKAHLPRSR